MVFDSAIIGTGPAGLSAALNLKIHNKTFIWLGSKNLSDKVAKAEQIRNYPGFISATGDELLSAFRRHAEAMELEITERMVNSVMPMGDHYALMAGADFFEAKTIILATGVAVSKTLPGESEFIGRGVSYCATCDGGLYKGKTVAVICNNPRFEHEVRYLSEIAEKVLFLPTYKNPGVSAENVETLSARCVKINGGARVSSVTLNNGENVEVNGVFVLRDSIALASLLPNLQSENGHIVVDRSMATNLPAVFAAGDCTGRPYQYTKAVGEGNVAAHSALEYLDRK